jgi:hypothetical protein
VEASVGFDRPQRRGQVTDQAVPEPARIIVRDLAADPAAAGVAVYVFREVRRHRHHAGNGRRLNFLSLFMPSALKDEFTKALDILVGAQSEQQIDHQHRQSGIGWKKRSDLLEKGEAMFAALGVAANRRLFREESNEQRSRPNDLQQTMGWSRS